MSIGTLVTANQSDALTTVTQLDSGAMTPGERLDVQMTLEDGTMSQEEGRLISPGLEVSTTTGAVDVRFEFDNPKRQILPGQFLRAKISR